MPFKNTYRRKRVVITGNTGFKGAWLTTWLSRLGAEVYGLANGVPTQPSIFELARHPDRMRHFVQDVTDAGGVQRIITEVQPDFVFHLAAQPLVRLSYDQPALTFQTNVAGTLNVLEALRRAQHRCCAVFITSDKAYDNVEWVWGYRENDALGGKDPYSASKGAAEMVLRSYARSYFTAHDSPVRIAVGRAGNVIGGGDWAADRIVPDAMRAWAAGQPLKVRSLGATRPWQHVLEPLSGYLALGSALADEASLNGEAFNFGPKAENNFTVGELLCAMQPYWPGATWMAEEAVDGRKEARWLKLNCDKALHQLSWMPTLTFAETAEFTARWYEHHYRGGAATWDFTDAQIARYELAAGERGIHWANS